MNKRHFFLLGATLLVVIFVAPLVWQGWTKNLISRIGAQNAQFAGEKALMDGVHSLNRDKLEREIIIGWYNPYQLLLYLQRSQYYFPEIEKKLKAAGLPDDFKYLAVAESALRDDAGSSAGAAGIWQLMPDTARQYGLRVDADIDERFHFSKSTDAAIQHLLKIHTLFESWALVAAGYNRGENGLLRDMAAQPSATTYWDAYLNNETGQYVYRIMAIKYLMQTGPSIFSASERSVKRAPLLTLTISGPVEDLAAWANERAIPYAQLRDLNPWIRRNHLPAGNWVLDTFVR